MDGIETSVASYAYDAWGVVTVNTENFSNGWHNPYLYDGLDRVRYDTETGLYWMSVRAYDPTLGRFISRDPLGRAPLMGWTTQPYAYASNNPLLNVDPSGQRIAGAVGAQAQSAVTQIQKRAVARAVRATPARPAGYHNQTRRRQTRAQVEQPDPPPPGRPIPTQGQIDVAIAIALHASDVLTDVLTGLSAIAGAIVIGQGLFPDTPKIGAAAAALGVIAVEAGLLSLDFKYEAKYDNWFWDDHFKLEVFRDATEAALSVINTAFVLVSLVAVVLAPKVAYVAGGAIAGAILAEEGYLDVVDGVVDSEKAVLGYT